MESRNHPHSVHVEELASQPRNRRRGLKHRLRRKSTETTDDLRTDGRELLFHKRIAGGNFIRFGIAILRGPALEDIADIDILTFEANGLDNLRQQLTGPADERQALLVFIVTRSFAYEYEFGIRITGTKDEIRTLGRKLAALAVPNFGPDGFELCGLIL